MVPPAENQEAPLAEDREVLSVEDRDVPLAEDPKGPLAEDQDVLKVVNSIYHEAERLTVPVD
jgi:hypothetical protein